MASIYISCPSFLFARFSNGNRKSNNISRFHRKPYSTQPITMSVATDAPIVRRTANYPPSQWSYDYLQSLTTNYTVEKYETRLHSLKERVRRMVSVVSAVETPLSTLELVDDLQRLGICYHFKDEIRRVLNVIYHFYYEDVENLKRLDLSHKALGFRLLRQHGYLIRQEIFEDIKDETTGNIKESVRDDIVGMLNLYEASFLAVEDEHILDKAREFTTEFLKDMLQKKRIVERSLLILTSHALELPLLWRIQRFEAVWFIEAYKERNGMKPMVLELATLDFNIVQGIHQEDLKYTSRWWDGLHWDKKLGFARDRLVESFIWAVGASYEPSFGLLRRHLTKIISLINVIDDVYDVYGTLDELERFTNVVRRWDINAIEELPDYMKICFLGFFNTINDMVYNTLTNQESLVLPSVKNAWVDYCEAILMEARWFNSGYTPTLEEYLKNSCTTVSLPVIVLSAYFFTSSDTTADDLHNIIHLSAMILRLSDDLGTSSVELKRGDVPKAVQCYMHETGATEEEGKSYVKKLIMETWKKLNKERMIVHSPSTRSFIEWITNLGRMAQFTYMRGDMFGSPDDLYTSHQISLIFNPKS